MTDKPDWNELATGNDAFTACDAMREAVSKQAELQAQQQQSNTDVLEAFRAHLASTRAYIAGLGDDDQ